MIDILFSVMLILIIRSIGNLLYNCKSRNRQHLFIYCPKCNTELIKNGQFISVNDGIVKYKCSNCGNISFWDFIHYPLPLLRTCEYCEYLIGIEDGSSYCQKWKNNECCLDTQSNFKHRR